jgi:hypothetical protein
MTDDDHTLRAILDREEIRDCLHRYTRGVDRADQELIRSAFHEDGIDCHGPVTGSVDDFLGWWLPEQDAREATQHYLTNVVIDLDGDVAHVESYFFVTIKLLAREDLAFSGGRYTDRLERRDGEWRIAVRVVHVEWTATGDAPNMGAMLARCHRGTRDRSDAVYERPLQARPAIPAGAAA